MYKKTIVTSILIMFILGSFSAIFASQGPDGNKRKGKYTYRKVYKACMEAGQTDSASPKLSPSNKKQTEWKEIFDSRNFSEFGCQAEWA